MELVSLGTFNGHVFTDLSSFVPDKRDAILYTNAWNGQSWMIGGGTPVAQLTPSHAWVVSYTSTGFADLSSMLPSYVSNGTQSSSTLTITSADGVWTIGGYSGNKGILLAYNDGTLTDYSRLVSGLTYVNWVSNAQNITF